MKTISRILFLIVVTTLFFNNLCNAANVKPTSIDQKFQIKMAYDGSNNLEYVGKSLEPCATTDTCWRILKITYSGSNATDIQYCDGSPAYAFAWDSRASCVYS